MLLTRRKAILGGGGALLLTALPAHAEAAYPSRTIKMIVPYPAGGTTDFLGRLVADGLKADPVRACG
jgi:tripartite-type tricarboxylate transporter receptor subunit TctC